MESGGRRDRGSASARARRARGRAEGASEEVASSYTLERIAAMSGSLSESELRVATAILEHPFQFLDWSAAQLGLASQTSAATAVRTCRRLGFNGLSDLRLTLARDLGWPASPGQNATRGASRAPALRELFDDASRSLQTMITADTTDAFRRATDLLDRSQRILAVAAGPSTVFAQDFVYNARLGGLDAEFCPDVIMQTLAASRLGRGDVCVAVSASGLNGLTVEAAEMAVEHNARLVAVTGYRLSRLAEIATVMVVAESLDYTTGSQAAINSAGLLLMLRALVIATVNRRAEQNAGSPHTLDDTRRVLGQFVYRRPTTLPAASRLGS